MCYLHRLIYSQANGPEFLYNKSNKTKLYFLDGNKFNCKLSNLTLKQPTRSDLNKQIYGRLRETGNKIKCYEVLESGERQYVGEYDSLNKTSKALDVHFTNVRDVCTGLRKCTVCKTSGKKYYFEYS